MAKDNTNFEIPAEMRAFAEKSVAQAKLAFDSFISAAQQAVNTAETHANTARVGAKEAGEGPLHSIIPAIANAIYDAIGVRIDALPFGPDKILRALRAKGGG